MSSVLSTYYKGWDSHNELLVRAISTLDTDRLSLRAAPQLWSVRTLANHIVGVRAWWFNGWMGEGGPELGRFLDFPDGEEAETRGAGEIVEALRSTWSSLATSLGAWTDADLATEFQRPVPNPEGNRPRRNRQYIVWHVAEHDLHHGGEISITLGMHGLPGLGV
jgi:uncharacterized damage-inducible protein DinB